MLFIDKKKIKGNTYPEHPLTYRQVQEENPNVSIPAIRHGNAELIEKVMGDIGYEFCAAFDETTVQDGLPDNLKEKRMELVGCTLKDGVWHRNYKAAKLEGESLRRCRFELRRKRDRMLTACDWTQGSDSPLSDADKKKWQTYRQALRDVTKNYDHPVWCKFPKSPAEE